VNAEPMRSWLDKWVTPTTVLALIGAIIWGIQLNAAVIGQVAAIARLDTRITAQNAISHDHSEQLIKLASIIDGMERRIESNTAHRVEHERDAQGWKHRIVTNEEKLRHIESEKIRARGSNGYWGDKEQ
jgi:hypothetical protein